MKPIDGDSVRDEILYGEAYVSAELEVYIKRVFDDAPTLDYKDLVPQGEWIEDGYAEKPCVCSYCGEEAHYTSTFRETFDYDWEENLQSTGYEEIREYEKSNFCPNCGARMVNT